MSDPMGIPVPVSGADAVSGKAASITGQAEEGRAGDEETFLELRRKVQDSELLSASAERLLQRMRFNGRLSIVVQNGRVVKSGYEEGYFRRKNDFRGWGGDMG